MKTSDWCVYGIDVELVSEVNDEVAMLVLQNQKVEVNWFHELLGHPGEAKTRIVAECHGVKLTGKFKACAACAKAKIGQANVSKLVLTMGRQSFWERGCILMLAPSRPGVMVDPCFGCWLLMRQQVTVLVSF